MTDLILGARIRQRRQQAGITQAELAKRVGISASYLNLIERNKRRIAGRLLSEIARQLGLSLDDLDGANEQRLAGTLHEVARLPHVHSHGAEADDIGELIGRFPGWANAIATLAESERSASLTARALADRLTHDPYLAETVHRMLTHISAVRSAAEILTDHNDLSDGERRRFIAIAGEESQLLSKVGEALAGYFDKLKATERSLTPLDEAETLFASRKFVFETIETIAETISVRDPARSSKIGQLSELPPALAAAIGEIVDTAPELETEAGRDRAHLALAGYARDAIALPLDVLSTAAAEHHYDIEAIAARLDVPFSLVSRRLPSLPQALDTPVVSYFQANAAGTITRSYLNSGDLPVARYSSVCPLWALFRAQQSPGTLLCQRIELPTGARFVFIAKTSLTSTIGYLTPRHYRTDMVAMTEADAAQTVYRPLLDHAPEPMGLACRICPRTDCAHRVDDPLA